MKKLMAAVQLDDNAVGFVRQASAWAQRVDGRLDLVSVVEPTLTLDPLTGGGSSSRVMEAAQTQRVAADILEDLAGIIPESHRGAVHTLTGPVAQTISARAATAELVLVGTHQRTGLSRVFLGSVAEGVLRNSTQPVLILPADTTADTSSVLVPIDPYHPQPQALNWLQTTLPNTPFTAVYALPWLEIFGPLPADSDAIYDRAMTALATALGEAGHPQAEHYVAIGESTHAGDVIVHEAEHRDASLIVLNTRGKKGIARMFLGSVAERVARTASMPVLIIPPRDSIG